MLLFLKAESCPPLSVQLFLNHVSRFTLIFIYLNKFKTSIMISKIKYAGILLFVTGYFLSSMHLDIGPINGAILVSLGCLTIAVYAILKLLGK